MDATGTNDFLSADGNVQLVEFSRLEICWFRTTTAQFKLEIKPEDDFNGNRQMLGIGEPAEVVVSEWSSISPPVVFLSIYATGVNTNSSHTLTGVSNDSNHPSTSRSFEAGHWAGSATLTVNVTVGGIPASDTIDIEVFEPVAVGLVQKPGTFKWHEHDNAEGGSASVGFKGVFVHMPSTVSFWKVQFREGTCPAEGKGYRLRNHGQMHPGYDPNNPDNAPWISCENGISSETNMPNTTLSIDTVKTGPHTRTPYSDGSFSWPIPRYFKIGTHQGTVAIVDHESTINSNGDTTISKGGIAKSAKFGDRKSTYETGPDQ